MKSNLKVPRSNLYSSKIKMRAESLNLFAVKSEASIILSKQSSPVAKGDSRLCKVRLGLG
jgi:hypothetical protein